MVMLFIVIWFIMVQMLEASGTRKLRDVNGWYHIVVRTDTTQAQIR